MDQRKKKEGVRNNATTFKKEKFNSNHRKMGELPPGKVRKNKHCQKPMRKKKKNMRFACVRGSPSASRQKNEFPHQSALILKSTQVKAFGGTFRAREEKKTRRFGGRKGRKKQEKAGKRGLTLKGWCRRRSGRVGGQGGKQNESIGKKKGRRTW